MDRSLIEVNHFFEAKDMYDNMAAMLNHASDADVDGLLRKLAGNTPSRLEALETAKETIKNPFPPAPEGSKGMAAMMDDFSEHFTKVDILAALLEHIHTEDRTKYKMEDLHEAAEVYHAAILTAERAKAALLKAADRLSGYQAAYGMV